MEKIFKDNLKQRKGYQAKNKDATMTSRFTRKTIQHPRFWMKALTVFADILGWALTLVLVWATASFFHLYPLQFHAEHLLAPIFYFIFALSGKLYALVGLNPVDEMRRIFSVLSISIGLTMLTIFFFHYSAKIELLFFLTGWFFSLFAVLFSRWIIRIIAVRLGLWGEPAVLIASSSEKAQKFAHYFGSRARLGIFPVLTSGITQSDKEPSIEEIPQIALSDLLASAPEYFASQGIGTALIELNASHILASIENRQKLFALFRQVVFLTDAEWIDGSFQVNDFEGMTGFTARQNMLSPANSLLKRMMDIGGALVLGLLSFPIWLLAIISIKRDSRGAAFYTQERIGKAGQTIKIFKFRTMVMNAEEELITYLAQNPAAKKEWEATQKLKNDPRITKPGRWLRKFSIDELPQLINILKGEMSLVGPRPLPQYHIDYLSEKKQEIRSSVYPGLTGMWQVSGRSNNVASQLERLDLYYVFNWSVWLDIYILFRTVWVVITQEGAS